MIKSAGIEFNELPDEKFDQPFEEASGAAVIFGATGGVMEAALRTVADVLTGEELDKLDYTEVRGTKGIKEATVKIGDLEVKAAIAHGLGNARALLESIRDGKADYDFIEIMACPGGCVGGGGQPITDGYTLAPERGDALYTLDRQYKLRFSHENPAVKDLYANKLLHTDHDAWELN